MNNLIVFKSTIFWLVILLQFPFLRRRRRGRLSVHSCVTRISRHVAALRRHMEIVKSGVSCFLLFKEDMKPSREEFHWGIHVFLFKRRCESGYVSQYPFAWFSDFVAHRRFHLSRSRMWKNDEIILLWSPSQYSHARNPWYWAGFLCARRPAKDPPFIIRSALDTGKWTVHSISVSNRHGQYDFQRITSISFRYLFASEDTDKIERGKRKDNLFFAGKMYALCCKHSTCTSTRGSCSTRGNTKVRISRRTVSTSHAVPTSFAVCGMQRTTQGNEPWCGSDASLVHSRI